MRFVERLRAARQRKHLSQEMLARLLGVTKQSVSCWECGLNFPSRKRLDQLCVLFDWDYDQMEALCTMDKE